MIGIVNGIDYKEYDPMKDMNIAHPYRHAIKKKSKNKIELQKELNLPQREDVPVLSIVTRLVEQKGLDLLMGIFYELMQEDIQFVLLGTGDHKYEQFFKEVANQYPDKVSILLTFNEGLARRIYAGSDIFSDAF
ncbi:MAG: hypothetical protein LRY71_01705 [Bacillaceae bacterium]|nr:hypothetical protein [Bacillaceae bacterium]